MTAIPVTAVPAAAPAQQTAARLLAQLDDIRGLDRISWWPPGVGWWVVLGALALGAGYFLLLYFQRRAYELSWKGDARKQLLQLEARLADGTTQDVAAALSILLRRIAMQRHSRAACAGLEGRHWLLWLKAQDPAGFDWLAAGGILIEAPYAPPGKKWPLQDVKTLLAAVQKWVQ